MWRVSGSLLLLAALATPEPSWVAEGRVPVFAAGELTWGVRQEGDRFVAYVRNLCNGDVTLGVRVRLVNGKLEPFLPVRVIGPSTEAGAVPVAAWRQSEAGRATFQLTFQAALGDMGAHHNDGYRYALPWPAPLTFKVGQGWNGGRSHQGIYAIDVGMPEGTPVLAAREGTVVATHTSATGHGTEPAWGDPRRTNFVIVQHPDRTLARYLHLQPGGAVVPVGRSVARGELIGLSGNTGRSSAPHLHFEVYRPTSDGRDASMPVKLKTAGNLKGAEPHEGDELQAFEFGNF